MIYDKIILGKRIKEIRLKRKQIYEKAKEPNSQKYYCCKTQQLFADELDVDRRTIIMWENGKSSPSIEYLLNICDILDCNLEYFLGADELPYIDSVAKVSHFTGIKPEIISFALKNSNYLDCLNFFMLPDNCTDLFNEITLSSWKQFWINENISEIQNPLLNIIYQAFDDFYLSTPMENINSIKFKEFLNRYLPEKKINFLESGDNNSVIYLKKCFSIILYKEFISKCPKDNTQYEFFIDFLCNLFYIPLQNNIYLELHKKKIADKFINTLTKYLHTI